MIEIRKCPKYGLSSEGVYATTTIKKSTIILTEKSLISVKRPTNSPINNDELYGEPKIHRFPTFPDKILRQFDALSSRDQMLFFDLYSNYPGPIMDSIIFDILQCCAFTGDDNTDVVFYTICKINHSCDGSTNCYVEISDNSLQLIAISDIEPDTEILINYNPTAMYSLLPKNIRSQMILENFKFKCRCSLCYQELTLDLFESDMLEHYKLKKFFNDQNETVRARLEAQKENILVLYNLYSKGKKQKILKNEKLTAFFIVHAMLVTAILGLALARKNLKDNFNFFIYFRNQILKSLSNFENFKPHLGDKFIECMMKKIPIIWE